MSNDTHKADQIAFHFYTKLFYVVNQARATAEPRSQAKVDKWFNLETPDSDLFTKEAREQYKNISLAPPPGPPALEIQVLLSIPELTNNQVLVYLTPESSRVRIEPTPRFIVLESWVLAFQPRRADEDQSTDVALPTIYKHGIPLFRSLYSLLRMLPAWKLYKRLKRRTGGMIRNGHLAIQLRVRSENDGDHNVLYFDTPPSPGLSTPLPTQSHTFSPVPHPLGSLTLCARYLSSPNFQLEELESVLSSRFISQDLDAGEFVPTLTKNHQRDSSVTSSTVSAMPRSPPKSISRAVSSSGGSESVNIAERFILPARTASTPGSSAGAGTRNIPQPARQLASGDFATQTLSGLAVSRLRKESLNSSPSSSLMRDLPTAPSISSLSSSPSSGPLPIRRPNINPVHPFKSNTVSSASGSSPSLSIRQAAGLGGGSPLSTGVAGGGHSRSASTTSATAALPGRHPPSPIGIGLPGPGNRPSPPTTFAPSSLNDKRSGTSGSAGSAGSDIRDRRGSMTNAGVEIVMDEGRVMPPRKRYSSSFGHRYISSAGSAGGGSGEGGGGNSGRSTPANQGGPADVGGDLGPRERKESLPAGGISSFLATTTDDDDISIFVQDIDARKPLSGRWKEREKRDWERQQRILKDGISSDEAPPSPRGQGHDREVSETTVKANTEQAPKSDGTPSSGHLSSFPSNTTSSTSPPSTAPSSRFSTMTTTTATTVVSTSRRDDHQDASTAAQVSTSPPLLSLSPTRGPMLTSQGEVEERLRRMNETFMKSLEGITGGVGGSAARKKERERKREKEREREREKDREKERAAAVSRGSRQDSGEHDAERDASGDDTNNLASYAGRGLSIRPSRNRGGPEVEDGRGWKKASPFSLGMGLRGSNNASTTSLGRSDEAAVSQGSEEVIGRMDFYEEHRRSGYRY